MGGGGTLFGAYMYNIHMHMPVVVFKAIEIVR